MLQHLYPVEGHENMSFDHEYEGRLNSSNGLGIAEMQSYDPMLSALDPFLMTPAMPGDEDFNGKGFTQISFLGIVSPRF
jgi:hypothetical protein